ncbi:hypothetical protein FS837_012791 [Tulasnella sp. UAMH 9824]|nr:hypothetical protein FS837_012791 [Tulasnella sp. UAMH 9824]
MALSIHKARDLAQRHPIYAEVPNTAGLILDSRRQTPSSRDKSPNQMTVHTATVPELNSYYLHSVSRSYSNSLWMWSPSAWNTTFGAVTVQKNVLVGINAVEFAKPADAEAIVEGITEAAFGILDMKTTLQKLEDHITESERKSQECVTSGLSLMSVTYRLVLSVFQASQDWRASATTRQKHCACAPSSKELERLPAYQTVLNKIKILRSRSRELSRIRYYSQNSLKQIWNVWPTCPQTTRKLKTQLVSATTSPASSAGIPDVDDDRLQDGLEKPIEGQEKEEAEQKRVRLSKKRKAEDKGRVRVEADKKRKVKEEAETLRQEEEEVRRKLEKGHVASRAILEKIKRSGMMGRGWKKLLRRQEIGRPSWECENGGRRRRQWKRGSLVLEDPASSPMVSRGGPAMF